MLRQRGSATVRRGAGVRKFAGNVSDVGSDLTNYPLSSREDFYVTVEHCSIASKIVPALVAVLTAKETEVERELVKEEVESIRDSATAIRVPVEVARDMVKERGYLDIDPENVWEEWLLYKKMTSES